MKSLNLSLLLIISLFVFNVQAGFLNSLTSGVSNILGGNKGTVEADAGKNIDCGTPRKLDVYFDENSTGQLKPVVIWVYGGAWVKGSKEEYRNFGTLLKERGYVGVLPSYVLFPFGKVEDMVDDLYHAIMWTRENIQRYGGDPNNITLSGHSAGAHLSALTTLKSYLGFPNKNETLRPLSFIKKLVLLNGPYDFDDFSPLKRLMNQIDLDNGLIEKAVTQLFSSKDVSPTDLLKEYPDNYLNGKLRFPKFVFFYTQNDIIVPQTSADGLIAQIERTNSQADVHYVFLNDMDHNTLTHGVKDDKEEFKDLYINLLNV